MSRGKNITSNQRLIVKVQIAKKLEISRCAIQNAIKHINKFGILENAPRTPRKRSTTERIDRIIRRLSEGNRRLTARDIYNEMKAYPECSLSITSWVEIEYSNRITIQSIQVTPTLCQPYRLYATTLCCSYQEFRVSYEVLVMY
uniref:HTH_Tnp_Tc3_2 domain-containing protein n=1 Tax=Heterorhabditis bacteriophora TaxID=37862 RepID=A0A1I7WRI4_HETBA